MNIQTFAKVSSWKTKMDKSKGLDGYFENLSQATQTIVREAILDAANNREGPEGYKLDDECIETIECHSRDGFIPFSHNRGGLTYRNFCDLMDYLGGGHTPAHDGAAKEIERQVGYSLKLVTDEMVKEIGPNDMEHFFNSDPDNVTCAGLTELADKFSDVNETEKADKVANWLSRLQEIENEYLSGSDALIMHEFRFMYHGINSKGMHEASVSAALNTEGPYHRSSISWSPNTFCEGSKEVEIKWRNNAELKRKLAKTLKQVSKAIF